METETLGTSQESQLDSLTKGKKTKEIKYPKESLYRELFPGMHYIKGDKLGNANFITIVLFFGFIIGVMTYQGMNM